MIGKNLSKDWYSMTSSEQGTEDSANHATQKSGFETRDYVRLFFVFIVGVGCCNPFIKDCGFNALRVTSTRQLTQTNVKES